MNVVMLLDFLGMHGTGKTHAAFKYCQSVKKKYSIVDTISFKKAEPFKDVAINFLHQNFDDTIRDENKVTTESVVEIIAE